MSQANEVQKGGAGAQAARFLIIGAWNTLFGYGVFFVLFWLVGESLHYLAIGLLAHFISVPQAFFAHRRLVFHSRGPLLAEFVRYNLSHVAGLATGLALLTAGVELLKLSAPVAQAIATVVTVALSFVMHKYFSFASRT